MADKSAPSDSGDTQTSYRPQQSTIVEDVDRVSVSLIPAAPKNRCLLTVLSGPQRGTVLKIKGSEGPVGRAEEADACIPDPGLSRVHARIFRTDDGFFVEDAGSTNGTFVDDERIEGQVKLEDGDRMRLGSRTIVKLSMHDELEEAATLQMHEAALRDRLTGVYNRGVFDDRLEGEFAFAKRHSTSLSLLLFDVDHFKLFNDKYGHQTGDAVLSAIGERVLHTVRTEDVVARYGGEEFAVIARGTTLDRATILAQRIRAAIAKIVIPWGEDELTVRVSIGVATMSEDQAYEKPQALVGATDAALYEAKRLGRDRIVVAPDIEPSS